MAASMINPRCDTRCDKDFLKKNNDARALSDYVIKLDNLCLRSLDLYIQANDSQD